MQITVIDIKQGVNECVVLKVLEDTNLWHYMLFPSGPTIQEAPNNTNRLSFFFQGINVQAGDFIIIFTGKGSGRTYKNSAGTTTYEFFWGLNYNIWVNSVNYLLICDVSTFERFKK